MIESIKSVIKVIRNLIWLTSGLLRYAFLKKNGERSYQAMIGLFCTTQGKSNDMLSKLLNIIVGKVNIDVEGNILGCIKSNNLDPDVIKSLRDEGYYIFKEKLDEITIQKLVHFALTEPAMLRSLSGEDIKSKSCVYVRGSPKKIRYDFSTDQLLKNEVIQNIISDSSFFLVAQEYLGCIPKLDVLSMWWHTDYHNQPDEKAAQFFHFDMDRPKWIKFFIYLTDVELENGPHTFVARSHQSKGIPKSLLKKGYVRLKDEEVETYYPSDSFIQFASARGTIFAEDTRGLHKGKHVEKGDRLVLQLQFSNSLFGGQYPKFIMPEEVTNSLAVAINKYPKIYENYT